MLGIPGGGGIEDLGGLLRGVALGGRVRACLRRRCRAAAAAASIIPCAPRHMTPQRRRQNFGAAYVEEGQLTQDQAATRIQAAHRARAGGRGAGGRGGSGRGAGGGAGAGAGRGAGRGGGGGRGGAGGGRGGGAWGQAR